MSINARDFIGVSTPRWIYIGISDRAAFDRIDRPLDHAEQAGTQVLTKTVEQDEVSVIFQHWLEDAAP